MMNIYAKWLKKLVNKEVTLDVVDGKNRTMDYVGRIAYIDNDSVVITSKERSGTETANVLPLKDVVGLSFDAMYLKMKNIVKVQEIK